ncbi:MAG: 50S ribosomal protein L18 [Chloroflexota bacterium]|nr:50S ribosomal protein L18 [Chloroflexota bacterium]
MAGTLGSRDARLRRHLRIRKRVIGAPARPRLCFFRSLANIYEQIIDDTAGNTLVSASTMEPQVKQECQGKDKKGKAEVVGQLVARRALEKGITKVVFDRGGNIYHGRVKALAEASRKAGLTF